jgi:predicted metal-binding protein
MTPEQIISKYENFPQISDEDPNEQFQSFYKEYGPDLREKIVALKEAADNLEGIDFKIGMMYPAHAKIDEEIKTYCEIPFRREDGTVWACEGVVFDWKGCPPHSPAVTETLERLKQAKAFLIMQFNGLDDTVYQKNIHHFTLEVRKALRESDYTVVETYSCGPCRMCARGCNTEEDCRAPDLRLFALESCGFWVNHLCRKASEYPLYGDDNWEIEWLIDWELPTQSPPTYRSVTGVLLG